MVEVGEKARSNIWRNRLISSIPYISAGVILVPLFPFLPSYAKSMLTEILIFGIFAMSLNLLVGYTGLFSLGHAAYFGVGGYTAGILIIHFGITNFWLAAIGGIMMAALTAAVFGILALRLTGLYFLFITLALGELLASAVQKVPGLTGGTQGLIGIGYPSLGIPITMNSTSFYYFVLIILVVCAFLLYRLVDSPFGHALQGIRDDEHLMRHWGYNTWLYKYIAFIIAGAFAGIAGILYGHFNSILVPGYLSVLTSTTVALMVILGGTNTIFGPILGAAVVLLMQYYASVFTPERWPLILGTIFVISVMFFREGIGIYLLRLLNRISDRYGSSKT